MFNFFQGIFGGDTGKKDSEKKVGKASAKGRSKQTEKALESHEDEWKNVRRGGGISDFEADNNDGSFGKW